MSGGTAGETALDVPGFADVEAAARRIGSQVRHTPVVTSREIDHLVGAEVAFKCENLQRAGAFKFRGASNAVIALPEPDAAGGVCTHSSGNHGAALALAARLRSIPATVVMPAGAPRVKRRAVESHGGEVVECEPTLAAREAALRRVVEERGGRVVHPYDNFHVIAGQGTAALELVDDPRPAPWCEPLGGPVDTLLVPVGGGGLLGGTTLVGAKRGCRVFGAEPAQADDAMRSLRAGRIIPVEAPDTIADGLPHLPRRAELRDHPARGRRHPDRVGGVHPRGHAAPVGAHQARGGAVGGGPPCRPPRARPPARLGPDRVVLSGGNPDLDALGFPAA